MQGALAVRDPRGQHGCVRPCWKADERSGRSRCDVFAACIPPEGNTSGLPAVRGKASQQIPGPPVAPWRPGLNLWVPKTCVTWVDALQIAVGPALCSGVGQQVLVCQEVR
jgi:hypothetical protein